MCPPSPAASWSPCWSACFSSSCWDSWLASWSGSWLFWSFWSSDTVSLQLGRMKEMSTHIELEKKRLTVWTIFRDFPLLHGVRESAGWARLWRHHPGPGPADGLLRLPADQTNLAGFQYARAPSHAFTAFVHEVVVKPVHLTLSLVCSDHPGYSGGHHHPAAHLPQEETSDCHRPHQRGQQVGPRPNLAVRSTFPFCFLSSITRPAYVFTRFRWQYFYNDKGSNDLRSVIRELRASSLQLGTAFQCLYRLCLLYMFSAQQQIDTELKSGGHIGLSYKYTWNVDSSVFQWSNHFGSALRALFSCCTASGFDDSSKFSSNMVLELSVCRWITNFIQPNYTTETTVTSFPEKKQPQARTTHD